MSNLQNVLEVKEGSNGLKTILGAVLIVIAGQVQVLRDLMPLFPDVEVLSTLAGFLQTGMGVLQKVLDVAGSGLLSVGLLHKVWKLFVK